MTTLSTPAVDSSGWI